MHDMECAALLCVLLSSSTLPQIRHYSFGRLTTADGLSSFRVYDIAQDSRGYLWIGTMNGLNRYDGHDVKVFRHDDFDSASLSHNVVRSLLVDRSGNLWVGTDDGGLNKFDRVKEHFARFVHDPSDSTSIPDGIVGVLYEDKARNLWIGVRGGGLNRLVFVPDTTTASGGQSKAGSQVGNSPTAKNRPVFIHYRHNPVNRNSLSDDRVYALVEDHSGVLWIGTETGLDAFDNRTGTFVHYKHDGMNPHSLSANFVRAICEDGAGILWVGTEGGGLNSFDKASGRFSHYRYARTDPRTISNDEVTCIFESSPHTLWVGTVDGLNKFNTCTGEFTRFKPDPFDPTSLLNEYLRSIRRDKSGVIWIVTDRGLAKIVPREEQFACYKHEIDNMKPQLVLSIVETHQKKSTTSGTRAANTGDALWIATEGLKRIDLTTGTITHYRHNPEHPGSIPSDLVLCLCVDSRGTLWIGTYGAGIARFEPGADSFTKYLWSPEARNWAVHTILEDRRGVLWLGTLGDGLLSFDQTTSRFVHFTHEPDNPKSLGNNNVYAILEDSRGTLWVGTEGGGLNRVDPERKEFLRYTHDPANHQSISSNRVYALHEDKQSGLWVSTESGLNLFDRSRGTFELLPGRDSISTSFNRIIEDHKGNLWLSTTQNGIFRFDPGTCQYKQFTVSDGLQGNTFEFAAWKRENGEIIFGGVNGFNVFHPDSIRDNTQVPGIALTAFKIYDKPARLDSAISETTCITLDYNENYFSCEFASLDFTNPSGNMYAYKLEGLDKDWFFPKDRHFASYTNIEPGKYVLRVRGSNNDGIWNEAGLAIPIAITPPYWATWWFKLFMGAIAVALVTAAYNYRVSKLLEMERMRVRIASDLHDDIGSSLSSIALITDMVRNRLAPDQPDRQLLQDASRAARHTADALKDIVWIVNPENDKLEDIILRMKDSAAKLLAGTQYSFLCPHTGLSSSLDMEFRRNLLLIYKEALNNIAKYARATKVDISIGEDQDVLQLRVKDNGTGFDALTVRRGNGLNNMKRRAEKIGGTLEICSSAESGTIVLLTARIA